MSILHTQLCNLLSIETPIIQAPIGPAAGPALAAAVSNAGGLGTITQLNVEGTRQRTRETRELTDYPFAVNLLLTPQIDRQRAIDERLERLKVCLEEGAVVFASFWDDPSHLLDLFIQPGL